MLLANSFGLGMWEGEPPGEPFAVNGSTGASPSQMRLHRIRQQYRECPNYRQRAKFSMLAAQGFLIVREAPFTTPPNIEN